MHARLESRAVSKPNTPRAHSGPERIFGQAGGRGVDLRLYLADFVPWSNTLGTPAGCGGCFLVSRVDFTGDFVGFSALRKNVDFSMSLRDVEKSIKIDP